MLSGLKAADPILATTSFATQHATPTTRFVTSRSRAGNGTDRLAYQAVATTCPKSGAHFLPRRARVQESAAAVVANNRGQ